MEQLASDGASIHGRWDGIDWIPGGEAVLVAGASRALR